MRDKYWFSPLQVDKDGHACHVCMCRTPTFG